ncbi:hypothetical protein OAB57_02295 [Bacteriovoracaceae bacterium]|nr:hypothetical protein [Bacteriovoracaceae bacterium]
MNSPLIVISRTMIKRLFFILIFLVPICNINAADFTTNEIKQLLELEELLGEGNHNVAKISDLLKERSNDINNAIYSRRTIALVLSGIIDASEKDYTPRDEEIKKQQLESTVYRKIKTENIDNLVQQRFKKISSYMKCVEMHTKARTYDYENTDYLIELITKMRPDVIDACLDDFSKLFKKSIFATDEDDHEEFIKIFTTLTTDTSIREAKSTIEEIFGKNFDSETNSISLNSRMETIRVLVEGDFFSNELDNRIKTIKSIVNNASEKFNFSMDSSAIVASSILKLPNFTDSTFSNIVEGFLNNVDVDEEEFGTIFKNFSSDYFENDYTEFLEELEDQIFDKDVLMNLSNLAPMLNIDSDFSEKFRNLLIPILKSDEDNSQVIALLRENFGLFIESVGHLTLDEQMNILQLFCNNQSEERNLDLFNKVMNELSDNGLETPTFDQVTTSIGRQLNMMTIGLTEDTENVMYSSKINSVFKSLENLYQQTAHFDMSNIDKCFDDITKIASGEVIIPKSETSNINQNKRKKHDLLEPLKSNERTRFGRCELKHAETVLIGQQHSVPASGAPIKDNAAYTKLTDGTTVKMKDLVVRIWKVIEEEADSKKSESMKYSFFSNLGQCFDESQRDNIPPHIVCDIGKSMRLINVLRGQVPYIQPEETKIDSSLTPAEDFYTVFARGLGHYFTSTIENKDPNIITGTQKLIVDQAGIFNDKEKEAILNRATSEAQEFYTTDNPNKVSDFVRYIEELFEKCGRDQ